MSPEPTLSPPPDLDAYLRQHPASTPADLARFAAIDQAERWRRGERHLAEEYLRRHPELAGDEEAGLDLIYSEFVLRQRQGEAPAAAEYETRFPTLAGRLRRLLQLDELIGGDSLCADWQASIEPVTPAEPAVALQSMADNTRPAAASPGRRGRLLLGLTALGVGLALTTCWWLSRGEVSDPFAEEAAPRLRILVWDRKGFAPVAGRYPREGDRVRVEFDAPAGLHLALFAFGSGGMLRRLERWEPISESKTLAFPPNDGGYVTLTRPEGTEVLFACGRSGAAVDLAAVRTWWPDGEAWPVLSRGCVLRLRRAGLRIEEGVDESGVSDLLRRLLRNRPRWMVYLEAVTFRQER